MVITQKLNADICTVLKRILDILLWGQKCSFKVMAISFTQKWSWVFVHKSLSLPF